MKRKRGTCEFCGKPASAPGEFLCRSNACLEKSRDQQDDREREAGKDVMENQKRLKAWAGRNK